MPRGVMPAAEWDARQAQGVERMSRDLWNRPFPLPDIPLDVVGADEWLQPGQNPHGMAGGYPDRKDAVQTRAHRIMVENPGVYTPEMAIAMAEKEEYTDSEMRIREMEDYFIKRGLHPDDARARAMDEEQAAWQQRSREARSQSASPAQPKTPSAATQLQYHQARLQQFLTNPPRGVRPDVLREQEQALRNAVAQAMRRVNAEASASGPPPAAPQSAGESRTSGASLPLPVEREVPFGSRQSWDDKPTAAEGLDRARVEEVANDLVAQGIPRDEAWSRAQRDLLRGPGRGGVPARAPGPAAPADEWAGWEAFDGADTDLVKQIATHLVRTQNMGRDEAWNAAQVEASRKVRTGTTSTHAQLDSRQRGGSQSELQTPNFTVPGPNDPTGVPTSVSRQMSPEEEYQYNYRAPSGSGAYDYSRRDQAQMDRGMVPIQTPTGVHYMVRAVATNQPGRDGVPGYRQDLIDRGYEIVTRQDVAGNDVQVYELTGAGAARAHKGTPVGFGGHPAGSPRARRARIKAIAEQGNMTYAEAEALVAKAERDGVGAPGSSAVYDTARDQAQTNRDKDRLARVKESRRQAMLAGGQPTGGPGGTRAFAAGLGMLPDQWQNQVLANQLSGGTIRGATPNDVQAAHNQQLTDLGMRVATGAGFAEGSATLQELAAQQSAAAAARQERIRRAAAAAWHDAWPGYEENDAREAMQREGAQSHEIEAILRDLRPPAAAQPQAAPVAPAAPAVPMPTPIPGVQNSPPQPLLPPVDPRLPPFMPGGRLPSF